jgi:hypothetical protein
MNLSSGSEWDLISSAYRNTRDHFDRVRLSTLAGSEVQKITAANGSLHFDASAWCRQMQVHAPGRRPVRKPCAQLLRL